MSASASAYVHVGFNVTPDDFWVTREHTDDQLRCPQGHTEGARQGKYCSECGGKFTSRESRSVEPTEKFVKLCKTLGIDTVDAIPPNEEWTGGGFDTLNVFCCDNYTDDDTPQTNHALGVRLTATGDILRMEGSDPVSIEKIQAAVLHVTAVRNDLGLQARPVYLYLVANCSY